jgi:hypothetical protein
MRGGGCREEREAWDGWGEVMRDWGEDGGIVRRARGPRDPRVTRLVFIEGTDTMWGHSGT